MISKLNDAVHKNNYNKVIQILTENNFIDINEKDSEGRTSLIYALSQDYKGIATILIESGADVNIVDKLNKMSALHYAIMHNDLDMIKMIIIKTNVNFLIKDEQGRTPLHYAIFLGNWDIALYLINIGNDIFTRNKQELSLLHTVAIHGDNNFIEELINRGVKINTFDNTENTPLHYAALYDNSYTIYFLIKKGALIDHSNNEGETPLHYASLKGNNDCVEALISLDADINKVNIKGESALHYSIKSKNKNTMITLLKNGINTNICSYNGTALHYAVHDYNVLFDLILFGVNANLKDQYGRTVFHELAKTSSDKKEDIIKLLSEHNVNINEKDNDGNTALHLAAIHQQYLTMKLLIKYGADEYIANNNHQLPSDLI